MTTSETTSSAEHFAAIGKVASAWAFIEAVIDTYCHELAGINYFVGVCFTSQVAGPARKMDALFALARYKKGDDAVGKTLAKLRERVLSAAERRNRVVHDTWSSGDRDPKRFQATARGKVIADWVDVPTAELLSLETELAVLADQLEQHFRGILALPDITHPHTN